MDTVMDAGYELINGRKVVKKHVATIHCSNKLSLLERKISNVLLYNAYPNLKKTLVHEISLDHLKRLLNAVTRNHKALKDALKTLISTVVEWNILGDKVPELDLEGWNASTILSSVSVKNGIVKYQYSELIKSLILDPSIYGKINLMIQSRFKSSYALALYENCSRYRGLKYTKEFPYSLFRRLMGVEGGKYEIFRDFNRRVLLPAVTEINTCSDIFIVPDIKRRGRKIHSIKFVIEERQIKKRLGHIKTGRQEIKNYNFFAELSEEFGMELSQVNHFISKYGEGRVRGAAEYVRSRPGYKAGSIHNLAGYLSSAITQGYQENLKERCKILDPAIASKKRLELKKNEDTRHEYDRYIVNSMKRIFDTLPIKDKKKIEDDFLIHIDEYSADNLKIYYNKFGINNILVFELGLAKYLFSQYPNFKEGVLSYNEFKQSANKLRGHGRD